MAQSLREKLEAAIRHEMEAQTRYMAAVQAMVPFDTEGIEPPRDAVAREEDAYAELREAQAAKQSILDALRRKLGR